MVAPPVMQIAPNPAELNLRADLPICESQLQSSGLPCNGTCKSLYGFNFTNLQLLTDTIHHNCPYDIRLARYPHNTTVRSPPALSPEAAYQIAGTAPTRYPYSDFYTRLTTWKVPLVQLGALFPRPPLGILVESFVFLRLLGNPIGTLQDIILKFASCQGRALYWKQKFREDFYQLVWEEEDLDEHRPFQYYERCWKAFALIVDSCDEWGREQGDYTQAALTVIVKALLKQENEARNRSQAAYENAQYLREECFKCFIRTAGALAADRGTKLFPVAVALALFMYVIVIAFVRTAYASGSETTVFINVEIYSVAFSALYFWILSLAPLGAAIGSSQTENAIARILNRLEREINATLITNNAIHITRRSNSWIKLLLDIREEEESTRSWARKIGGGIYSWQPANWPSTLERVTRFSSDKIDEIKADIANLHDNYHTPPCFPQYPATFWPYPAKICRDNDSPIVFRPFIYLGCGVVGLIPYIFCWVFWICWLGMSVIRRYTGPIVPGSPLFPLIVISSNLFAAWIISMQVPPREIFGCRPKWQLFLFSGWWLSWLLDCFLLRSWCLSWLTTSNWNSRSHARWLANWKARIDTWITNDSDDALRFYSGLLKEFLCVVWTFSDIIITQWGIMNKASCYIDPTHTYLILPGSPPVNETLHHLFYSEYLLLTLLLIILQLFVIPIVVGWQFFEAWQVFVQRDDEKPHWKRWQRIRSEYLPWGNQPIPLENRRLDISRGWFERLWSGMPPAGYIRPDPLQWPIWQQSFNPLVETKIYQAITFLSDGNAASTLQSASTHAPRNSSGGSHGGTQDGTQDETPSRSRHGRDQSFESTDQLLPTHSRDYSGQLSQQGSQLVPQSHSQLFTGDIADTTGHDLNSPVPGVTTRTSWGTGEQSARQDVP